MQVRVGGLPIDTTKGGELHYGLSWSPAGLIQEYTDTTVARKDGVLVRIHGLVSDQDWEDARHPHPGQPAFGIRPFILRSETLACQLQGRMEPAFFSGPQLDVPGSSELPSNVWAIQTLEARPTSDGISLMPFDPAYDNLRNLEYKTLRFAGHFDRIVELQAHGQLDSLVLPPATPDLVLLRVWVEDDQQPEPQTVEVIVLCDPRLGLGSEPQPRFTAMQHLTGWPTVLVAHALLTDREHRRTDGGARPDLLQSGERVLWSGRTLDDTLNTGGVIMPYELIDGGRLLGLLDTDDLIPQRQFIYPRQAAGTLRDSSELEVHAIRVSAGAGETPIDC